MKDISNLTEAEMKTIRRLLRPINTKPEDTLHFCKVFRDGEGNEILVEEEQG